MWSLGFVVGDEAIAEGLQLSNCLGLLGLEDEPFLQRLWNRPTLAADRVVRPRMLLHHAEVA